MPKRLTTKEFIIKAKLVHGDTYDYSNVKYVGAYDNVDIICPKHGKYSQMAHNHLFGKLYRDTIHKLQTLKSCGYSVEYIWEKEWNMWNRNGQVPTKKF